MADPGQFVTLRHGTTRRRAERIVAMGPDQHFRDPGDLARKFEGFWSAPAGLSPEKCVLGIPEAYAERKSMLFPEDGEPVILEFDVPQVLMNQLLSDPDAVFLAESGGVCFNVGSGLEELLQCWPTISRRVIPLTGGKP